MPYTLWARQGLLETCPGRAIDKGFVVRRMAELVADFKVEACAFDRWGIHELKRILADEGVKIEMVEWGQGWKDSSPALAAIETAVLQGKLRHQGHPIMRMECRQRGCAHRSGRRAEAGERSLASAASTDWSRPRWRSAWRPAPGRSGRRSMPPEASSPFSPSPDFRGQITLRRVSN